MNCKLIDPLLVSVSAIIFTLLPYFTLLPLAELFGQTPVAFRENVEAKTLLAPHGTRFYFDIIESCDARYLGDTPSHIGKHGGLDLRPRVALGDNVYRTNQEGQQIIGIITQINWDRVSGSLSIEFAPKPLETICVGEEVWVDINPDRQLKK
jgi:hypothetical protein